MSALSGIQQALNRRWMGIYLLLLALFLAYGALVHLGNILGFGEVHFSEAPLAWQIGDVYYLILNLLAVIGLWQRKPWGVAVFLVATVSQFVTYTVLIDYFVFTDAQRETVIGLLGTEALLVTILVALYVLKK